jgi:hypothetical protein
MTTLLRLLTIIIYTITMCLYLTITIMNFNMLVTTISHYNNLGYEIQILFMYVMNMYIIKYKKFRALNF